MPHAQHTNILSLAVQWRVFALLIVVFARRAASLHYMRCHTAAAEAETLEIAARSAVYLLTRQLQEIGPPSARRPGETRDAYHQLLAVLSSLMILMAFAAALREQVNAATPVWLLPASGPARNMRCTRRAPIFPLPILDSS